MQITVKLQKGYIQCVYINKKVQNREILHKFSTDSWSKALFSRILSPINHLNNPQI